jgi:polysaccharide biosynthesis/export protein
MFKSLVFAVALLSGSSAAFVSAQAISNYTDSTRDATYRTATPEAKAEAKRLYKEGVKYGLAGLFQQAVEILQRSIKLDPQNADAHFALGHAYFDLKQWRNSVEALKAAVALAPNDAEARDRLGLARAMLWEDDNARLIAQGRLRPPPSSVPAESKPQPLGQQVSINAKVAAANDKEPTSTPPAVTGGSVAKAANDPAPKSASPVVPVSSVPPPPSEASAETSAEVNAAAAVTADELALTKIYRVGPSDVLDIRINDNAATQSTLFTVTPAGFIEHPMLSEPLQAGGLTVDEISSKFESELKRRALVDNPKVLVGVRDYASHTILVSGLVKDSGTKVLRREAIPLYVVVADAQPLPEAARATVLRNESNQTFEIDLTQSSQMNRLVRPGDVITLHPSVTQFVYIGGEVKSPGEKIYRRGLTLTQALIAAGGVTPNAKEARLGRDDGKGFLVVTRYKLKDIESGKAQDPIVKPGDRITIKD